MATSECTTDEFPFFPPLQQEVPVETIIISAADSDCHHKLDDPLCNCDNNIMPASSSSTNTNTNSSLQETPAMSRFWEWVDKYDWNTLASREKLVPAVSEFLNASKDVINYPDCQDVRKLLAPVFMTQIPEAMKDPRAIARYVIETYGLKDANARSTKSHTSSSSSSPIIVDERNHAEKKAPAPTKKEKGKGTKLRNFTKEEDLFLSKAYVRVSLDPIRGNDQKSQDFWAHVFRIFVAVYRAEAEVQEDDMSDRNADSIKSRFQRNIQKDVIEFCAICRTNEMKSGESQEDYLGRMDKIFDQKKNKPFRFRHCLPVLSEIPKFDWETKDNSNIDEVADDFLNTNSEEIVIDDAFTTPDVKSKKKSSFVNNASGLKRPPGTKAAKRKVVENYLDDKVEQKKMRILEDVATGLHDMADAIQKKQYREHLQSMLMIYQSLGNQQQMLSYLQKLEALTVDPRPAVRGGGDMPDVDVVTIDNNDNNDNGSSPNTDATTTVEKEDISSELNKELEKIMRETQE